MRAALIVLAGVTTMAAASPAALPHDDPLIRPITGADGARWLEPQGTARVFGKTWYIGSRRLRQAVIDTGNGLILIDGGLPEGFAAMRAQLTALGLDVARVRIVLVTEPHYDHAGAIAAIVRASGARVYASPSAADALRRGMSDADDPQFSSLIAYPPVGRVHALRDGETVRLGKVTVTAQAMSGHTLGSMGFAWRTCERKACRSVRFAASLNPLATGDFQYADNPALVAAMHGTFTRLRASACDILLTGHPEHSGADLRVIAALDGKADPFASPRACAAMADRYEALLDKQIPAG